MSHATASSAQSDPIHVTWDEWDIVGDMIGELSTAVASSRDYSRAEAALLNCMNGGLGGKSRVPTPAPTYTSFDQILSMYASTTKELMEDGGACAAPSETMFNTNQRVARTELARLKAGSAVYAGWLATPQGLLFEANVADSAKLKLFSYLMALQPSETSNSGRDVSGNSDTTPPPGLEPGGFDCFTRAGWNPTLNKKLEALNCLVFGTPHSFWREHGDDLKQLVEDFYWLPDGSMTIGPFRWFGYGGWDVCSAFPDVSRAICRKHDAIWGSLKKFDGIESAGELDAAWNPRNKQLADIRFYADILRYGCDAEYGIWPPNFIAPRTCEWVGEDPRVLAEVMRFGLRGGADFFHLGDSPVWTYTQEDIQHTEKFKLFVQCDGPHLANVRVTPRRAASGYMFETNWEFEDGCGQGTEIGDYSVSMSIVFQPNCSIIPHGPLELHQVDNSALARFRISFVEISALPDRCDTTSMSSMLSVRAWPRNVLLYSGRYDYEFLIVDIPTELEHGQ